MPTLIIPGGNRTVQESWEVSLQGFAEYPSPYVYNSSLGVCQASQGMGSPLDFAWSVDTTNNDFQFQNLPPNYLATRLSAQLTIPSNFLKVNPGGELHCRQLFICLQASDLRHCVGEESLALVAI